MSGEGDGFIHPRFRMKELPPPSDWQMRCAGVTYVPELGTEPNGFHRFMQWLVLGFRWERREGLDKGKAST